jgi:hypothetical protein
MALRPIVNNNEREKGKMHWKIELRRLELNQEWDCAIELMEKVIKDNPTDVDGYIFIMFLIKNLLIEEDYNRSKRDFYTYTLKQYFDCSYTKFKHNAEYLFCSGWIACMCPWYFGITEEDADKMINQSLEFEPHNLVYKSGGYRELDCYEDIRK